MQGPRHRSQHHCASAAALPAGIHLERFETYTLDTEALELRHCPFRCPNILWATGKPATDSVGEFAQGLHRGSVVNRSRQLVGRRPHFGRLLRPVGDWDRATQDQNQGKTQFHYSSGSEIATGLAERRGILYEPRPHCKLARVL